MVVKATVRRTSRPRVRRIATTKARINLGAIVKDVHLRGEYVVLEKGGIPVAALIDVEAFEDYLDQHDPQLRRIIPEGYADYLAGKTRPADELTAELSAASKTKSV